MKKTYTNMTNSRGDFQANGIVRKGSGREYNVAPKAQKTVDASFIVTAAGLVSGIVAVAVNFIK